MSTVSASSVSQMCCALMKPPTPQLTRCGVKLVRKDHNKKRGCIFGGIHQMWKRLLRVPIASNALGKPKIRGKYGHNGMQNGYILHTVIAS